MAVLYEIVHFFAEDVISLGARGLSPWSDIYYLQIQGVDIRFLRPDQSIRSYVYPMPAPETPICLGGEMLTTNDGTGCVNRRQEWWTRQGYSASIDPSLSLSVGSLMEED